MDLASSNSSRLSSACVSGNITEFEKLLMEPGVFHSREWLRKHAQSHQPRCEMAERERQDWIKLADLYTLATKENQCDILRSLFNHFPIGEAQYLSWGPVLYAIKHGFHGILEIFLEHDPLLLTRYYHPFNYLLFSEALSGPDSTIMDVFRVMLDACVRIDLPPAPREQKRVIFEIYRSKKPELAELMESYGAVTGDINKILVASGKNLHMVKYLIERGADPNEQNSAGCTPLRSAAGWGSYKIVNFLLERGADPSITTIDGLTPLEAAQKRRDSRMGLWVKRRKGFTKVIKILEKHKAQESIDLRNRVIYPAYRL